MSYTSWRMQGDRLVIGRSEGDDGDDALRRTPDGTWPWADRAADIREVVVGDESTDYNEHETWPELPDDCSGMFANLPNLTFASLATADTWHVNDMTSMFDNDAKLRNVSFDDSPSTFDSVRHMSHMFRGCSSLEQPVFTDDLDEAEEPGNYLTPSPRLCPDAKDVFAGTRFEGMELMGEDGRQANGYTGVSGGVVWHLDTEDPTDGLDDTALVLAPLEGDRGELPEPDVVAGIPQWPWRVAAGAAHPERTRTDPDTGRAYVPADVAICDNGCAVRETIALPEDASYLLAGCRGNREGWSNHFDTSRTWRVDGMYAGTEAELNMLDGKGSAYSISGPYLRYDPADSVASLNSPMTLYEDGSASCRWAGTDCHMDADGILHVTGRFDGNLPVSDAENYMRGWTMNAQQSGLPAYIREHVRSVDMWEADTSELNDMSGMFAGCPNLTDVSGLSAMDTISATDMSQMFSGCESLQSVDGLKDWDTAGVTDMCEMFAGCKKLRQLDGLRDWDTSNVEDMMNMFADCKSLSDLQPLSAWDTSMVMDTAGMFAGDVSLTDVAGLARWDMSNCNCFDDMFENCANLTDVSGLAAWDVSGAGQDTSYESGSTGTGGMFRNCTSLSDVSPLEGWDTDLGSSPDELRADVFINCPSLSNGQLEALCKEPQVSSGRDLADWDDPDDDYDGYDDDLDLY